MDANVVLGTPRRTHRALAALLALLLCARCEAWRIPEVHPRSAHIFTGHIILFGAGLLIPRPGVGQQTLGRVKQFSEEEFVAEGQPSGSGAGVTPSESEAFAQRQVLAALANSLVLHAVSLENQLLLVVVTPRRIGRWVAVLEEAGRNVSRVLPLACVFSPGTPTEEHIPLRFLGAVDRRCFIRCQLPGPQHVPGSKATVAIIEPLRRNAGSDPATGQDVLPDQKRLPLLVLRSEATLGPRDAALSADGSINMTEPIFGYEYLGQRMVMEVSTQRLSAGKGDVPVFSKGLDVDQLKAKQEKIKCVYGPPLWYRNSTGLTQGASDGPGVWPEGSEQSSLVWVADATSEYSRESTQSTCPQPPVQIIQQWRSLDVSSVTLGSLPAAFDIPDPGSYEKGASMSVSATWEVLVPVTLADPRGLLPTSAFFDPFLESPEDWLPQGQSTNQGKAQGNHGVMDGAGDRRHLLQGGRAWVQRTRPWDQRQRVAVSKDQEGRKEGPLQYGRARRLQEVLENTSKEQETSGRQGDSPPFFLCSCMIVWDHVESLYEWALYHAWMGVEQLQVYDNDSDDGLSVTARAISKTLRRARHKQNPPAQSFPDWEKEGKVAWYQRWEEDETAKKGDSKEPGKNDVGEDNTGGVHVALRNWPWLKTQGAASAHCLVSVEPICTWALVADIDEFLLPKFVHPPVPQGRPALDALRYTTGPFFTHWIQSQIALYPRAGSLRVPWYMYRPSGHECRPPKGITPSYDCRDKNIDKMSKSVVLIEAVAYPGELENIHRFSLKPPYWDSFDWEAKDANMFHYKYQAWEDYKKKYYRRACGTPEFKVRFGLPENWPNAPPNWSNGSCDVKDSSMANFVKIVFGDTSNDPPHYPWEVQRSSC